VSVTETVSPGWTITVEPSSAAVNVVRVNVRVGVGVMVRTLTIVPGPVVPVTPPPVQAAHPTAHTNPAAATATRRLDLDKRIIPSTTPSLAVPSTPVDATS